VVWRTKLCLVHSPVPIGPILSAVVARFDAGGDGAPSGIGGVGGWVLTLTSLVALLAAGGAAARVARRLMRRSTPELVVLLNQSAAFYVRWPEDRLDGVPDGELMAETARCRRIIELLESRRLGSVGGGPATRGAVDGVRAWTSLLCKRIEDRLETPSGSLRSLVEQSEPAARVPVTTVRPTLLPKFRRIVAGSPGW